MSGERDLLVSCREDVDPQRLRPRAGDLRPMVPKLVLGAKLDETHCERSMREVEASTLDAMNAALELSVTTGRQLVHSLASGRLACRVMSY